MIDISQDIIQWVNLAVLVFYIIFIFLGIRRGFILSVISAVGSVASFLIAWRYCSVAVDYFHFVPDSLLPMQDTLLADTVATYVNELAWFLVIFLVLKLILAIISKAIASIENLPVIKQLSGLLGGIFGMIVATVWIIIFCVILNIPIFENGSEVVNQTWLGRIRDDTSQLVSAVGAPTDSAEMINRLYRGMENLDDSDKDALREWLEEHGFETIEEDSE